MVIDILVLLLIVSGVAFGLWKGLINQGLAILGVYLGALLARFLYEPLARLFVSILPLDLRLVQLIMFLLIIIAVPALLLLAAHAFWGSLRLPHAWGQLDLVGGTFLGAVVGLLAAMFLVLAVGYLAASGHVNPSAANFPLFGFLESSWSSSLLRGPVVQVGQIFYYMLFPNAGKTIPDILQVFAPR